MASDRQTESQLTALRRARGLSREGLAYKAGLSLRTVERLESGERVPHRATKHMLAKALGVTPAELGLPSTDDDPDLLPAA